MYHVQHIPKSAEEAVQRSRALNRGHCPAFNHATGESEGFADALVVEDTCRTRPATLVIGALQSAHPKKRSCIKILQYGR